MLLRPARSAIVDISSLLERPSRTGTPANASSTSQDSSNGPQPKQEQEQYAPHAAIASAALRSPYHGPQPTHGYPPPHQPQYGHPQYGPPPGHWQPSPQATYPPPGPPMYGAIPPPYSHPLPPMQDPNQHIIPLQAGIPITTSASNKRLAPPTPHPAENPAKKKQSKWSQEEDAAIIELRGNGMKWEDISKHLPGRSAISCRLRFQNYLERRSEWDEEKKNKLARLYERYVSLVLPSKLTSRNTLPYPDTQTSNAQANIFKKDMWEKIAKEMALPWRAAEAMHWQIGEIEMANRANVPVFHLAGHQNQQQQPSPQPHPSLLPQPTPSVSVSGGPQSVSGVSAAGSTRSSSTSPSSAGPGATYPHQQQGFPSINLPPQHSGAQQQQQQQHSHTLPHLSISHPSGPSGPPNHPGQQGPPGQRGHSISPEQNRTVAGAIATEGRDRADSARSVTAGMHRAFLGDRPGSGYGSSGLGGELRAPPGPGPGHGSGHGAGPDGGDMRRQGSPLPPPQQQQHQQGQPGQQQGYVSPFMAPKAEGR
ncbi:hypothetical protein M8818_005987 [Zalaria obscura]|uniref:Uncharacterized protein n=1 Tax=Zalaria obscura TaxID=2024903 RepID=A0ACC3S6P8_9PEZI